MSPSPRWLSSAEREAWLRTVAVLELFPAALDAQLHRDDDLTMFEYLVLAMLSEAPDRTLRMSELASHTNATLPRLSRVVGGLERAGFVDRRPCSTDRRATNAVLTADGWRKVVAAAPGHVGTVRRHLIDPLTPAELDQFGALMGRILETLDPDGRVLAATRLAAGGGAPDDGASGSARPLPRLASPAARGLREAGYTSLESLAGASAAAIGEVHGVGRGALRTIRAALADAGLAPLTSPG